jgi:outer membrane lipoprotein SlyB
MNRKQQSVLLASLLAVALAGCSSTKGSGDETASTAGAGGMAAQSAAAAPPSEAQLPGAAPADMAMMPAGAPNAVVMSIEPMPRQGAVGGSGTAGATGSSMDEDKAYRVTLRMDDGTTRVVTQEKAPTYRTGDRVNMMDGVISR